MVDGRWMGGILRRAERKGGRKEEVVGGVTVGGDKVS